MIRSRRRGLRTLAPDFRARRAALPASVSVLFMAMSLPVAAEPVLSGHGSERERAPDVVTPRSGRPFGGRIVAITPETLRMQVVLASDRGRGSGARSFPMEGIERIRFGLSGDEERALAAPESADVSGLLAMWNNHRAYLRYPRSPAGRFGTAYATQLLARDGPRDAEKALEACDAILAFDWSDDHKAEARVLRLRSLLALGRAEEALVEAERLAEQTDDPAMLIEARFVLALDDRERLAALQRDNPRWQEDDEVRPARQELFNRALDGFLFPFLFHGSRAREAARGLVRASELCADDGDPGHAAALARDLVELYPESPEAENARRRLDPAFDGSDRSPDDDETDAPEQTNAP